MSNLPPGVTLADIDRHFGPPRCEVLVGDDRHDDEPCGRAAEDFKCGVCGTPLCDRHAGFGGSSCCPQCQKEVDVAMDEFSFLRFEQMLREHMAQARRWIDGQGREQPQYLGEVAAKVRLLEELIDGLVDIRTGRAKEANE